MRIIAGEFKGRKLFTPNVNHIRPTSDKVKESIFSMIAGYLEDAVVVDLFTGTGNLGLEAISRGASRCYFGDKSRDSLDLTLQNIAHCKANDQSIVIHGDFERVLRKIQDKQEKADIIFLDPPYHIGLLEKCFQLISELSVLDEDGIIVAEHSAGEQLPEIVYGLKKMKERKYGTIAISIYAVNLEE